MARWFLFHKVTLYVILCLFKSPTFMSSQGKVCVCVGGAQGEGFREIIFKSGVWWGLWAGMKEASQNRTEKGQPVWGQVRKHLSKWSEDRICKSRWSWPIIFVAMGTGSSTYIKGLLEGSNKYVQGLLYLSPSHWHYKVTWEKRSGHWEKWLKLLLSFGGGSLWICHTMDGIVVGAHERHWWPGETGRQRAIQGEACAFIPVHFIHKFSGVPWQPL